MARAVAPFLLSLPAIVLVAVFLYGVINGLLQGFGVMPFLDRYDLTLEYWADVFQRPDLLQSVTFSLYISLTSSVVALVGGIVLSAAICAVRSTQARACSLACSSTWESSRMSAHSPLSWDTPAVGVSSPATCGRRCPSWHFAPSR